MSFTVKANIDVEKLAGFDAFANRRLQSVVREGSRFGDETMTAIVPRGITSKLATAVGHSVSVVGPGHYVGTVGVDQAVAPYADKVNQGTGIDGPHRQSVVIKRSSRDGKSLGAMKFKGEHGETVFRHEVKFRPSEKIRQGKNFHRKTFRIMREWTSLRVSVLTGEFAAYFARNR